MVIVKSVNREYEILFPSFVNEITAEHLTELTKNINVPRHHVIVSLCYATKLFDFCAIMNSKRGADVGIVPLLAKINENDKDEVCGKVGEQLIVPRTSLERGVHLNIKCEISMNRVKDYINSDPELLKNILSKKDISEQVKVSLPRDEKDAHIIILEFKVIPVVDIAASVTKEGILDPFKHFKGTAQA